MGLLPNVRLCVLLAGALLSSMAQAQNSDWARWLQQQLAGLPDSRAIVAEEQRAQALSQQLDQPLYNPALNIGYQNSADNSATLGLSQTLDWAGKGRANRSLASLNEQLAVLRSEQARAALQAEALAVLVTFAGADARLAAANQQQQRLATLTDLIRRRAAAGDLGQLDAQLAYLAQGQAQQALAAAEGAASQATTALQQRLAVARPTQPLPPATRWNSPRLSTDPKQRLLANLTLQLAQAQLQLAQAGVTVASRQRRADPTLGVSVGRDGDDSLWGLDFSLPLQLFNTGEPGYRAALADSDQRQALLEQARNRIQAQLQGALRDYQQQQHRWQRWQQLSEDSLARSETLLERLWQLGELTTADYLQALNQRLDSELAGIALREAMQQAWVQWLYHSNQLNDWLSELAYSAG